jgi:hypothetical protein
VNPAACRVAIALLPDAVAGGVNKGDVGTGESWMVVDGDGDDVLFKGMCNVGGGMVSDVISGGLASSHVSGGTFSESLSSTSSPSSLT